MVDTDKVEYFHEKMHSLKEEIDKVVYGQDFLIKSIIKCLACDSHALLEGVPGTGKTLSIRTLSKIIEGVDAGRVQFTPDLLPSDIVGTTIYTEGKGFEVKKGPVFCNLMIADEINRTPPKVQSAMLQAMQEREVTIGKQTFHLPDPFMVLATQNPLEQKGTYPLSEAQVDRFLFKIDVGYNPREGVKKILTSNLEVKTLDDYNLQKIINKEEINELQEFLPTLQCSEEIKKYIVNIVDATRNPKDYGLEYDKYIKWGGSPRASIYLTLAAKANALYHGREFVIPEDVQEIAINVLRHRIVLNYEGKAEELNKKDIVNDVFKSVPVQ